MFDQQKAGLGVIFSRRKYAYLALGLFFLFFSVYAVLTDVVVLNPLYFDPSQPAWHSVPIISFNSSLQWWNAIPTVLLAALLSLGFSIAAFQLGELSALAPASQMGALGGLMGTLASACPVCQPIWLFWLGFGSASAFLADWSPYILLASLALLSFSVHSGLRLVAAGCPIKKA